MLKQAYLYPGKPRALVVYEPAGWRSGVPAPPGALPTNDRNILPLRPNFQYVPAACEAHGDVMGVDCT